MVSLGCKLSSVNFGRTINRSVAFFGLRTYIFSVTAAVRVITFFEKTTLNLLDVQDKINFPRGSPLSS